MAGVTLLLCVIHFLLYIYGSYRKIKTGVPLFGPPGRALTEENGFGILLSSLVLQLYEANSDVRCRFALDSVGCSDGPASAAVVKLMMLQ